MPKLRQPRKGKNLVSTLAKSMQKAIDSGETSAVLIAEAASISRIHVYRIINGENTPSLDVAEKIASHLGLKFSLTPAS